MPLNELGWKEKSCLKYVSNKVTSIIKTIGVDSFSFEGFQTKFENKDYIERGIKKRGIF